MSEPKRIQRKRTKGWKMPDGAVFVGRPTRWGNPFIVGEHGTASECVLKFALSLDFTDIRDAKAKLRGKDLACWCSLDSPCHADILLEVANSNPEAPTKRHRPIGSPVYANREE